MRARLNYFVRMRHALGNPLLSANGQIQSQRYTPSPTLRAREASLVTRVLLFSNP